MMRNVSLSLFFLVLSLTGITLSCQKGKDNPTPVNSLDLVTGNPTITGISGATVVKGTNGNTFTITVPAGTNIKSLKIAIPTQTGANINPDPVVARDYTNPVQYVITGADGSKQTVTVKVEVRQGPQSAAKQITGLSFAALNPAVTATIDETTHIITASVSSGTDITKLVPTIVVSDKATVSPASGTVQNFTNPVNYTVKAEDGSTQVYEVKVNKTTVGSDKACLVTDINYVDEKDAQVHISFQYYPDGKVSKIKFEQGGLTSVSSFEYNSDGELIAWKTGRWGSEIDEMRIVYAGGRAVKLQGYKASVFVDEQSMADFGLILNDKNEVIETNHLGIIKFGYTNGNVTETQSYDIDTKELKAKAKIEYDTKHNFLSVSNPKGVSSYFYWISGLMEMCIPSFVNNWVKVSAGTLLTTFEYTYSANGFPLRSVAKSNTGAVPIITYTYSNCP